MTLYRESMRRLFRVGITLMTLTVAASLITAIMKGGSVSTYVTTAVGMSPVLALYAFVGGAGLALAGFSFLNKRVESDFYHSIPVRRIDLYLSITAAAATWMLFTIAISSAMSAVVYLILGQPFAPLYPFMNAGYFFAAALLVFAATSIGCTITGTWFTNVILTCLVLFLPRYILFMIGRTLIADTAVMSWLDLRGFLDPTTNAATGIVVMLSRPMLQGGLVNGLGILWSLVLAALELAAGALLFRRRPSELAEQGASSRVLQIVFASLLSLTVLLVYTVRAHEATKIFTCIIVLAAFACYTIYQTIVLRSLRRVLLSLPWFLCSVAVAAAIMFGSQAAAQKALNTCPTATEIASVRFPGAYRGSRPSSYANILTAGIEFTEEGVRECVADALRQNVDSMNSYGYVYTDSIYSVIEPVYIRLQNGRTICRKLEFPDGKTLNECRLENKAYADAILQLPPDDTVKRAFSFIASLPEDYRNYDTQPIYTLCEYYFGEQRADGALVPYEYHDPDQYKRYEGRQEDRYYGYTPVNEEQNVGSFAIGGYIGAARYYDNFSITLRTPMTASYYMRLRNQFGMDTDCRMLTMAYNAAIDESFVPEVSYMNINLDIMNCPMDSGDRQWAGLNWYVSKNDEYDSAHLYPEFQPLMDELVGILRRGALTDDCSRVAVMPHYMIELTDGRTEQNYTAFYLAFSPEDERRLLDIVGTWSVLTESRYTVAGDYQSMPTLALDAPVSTIPPVSMPTPTPRPAG